MNILFGVQHLVNTPQSAPLGQGLIIHKHLDSDDNIFVNMTMFTGDEELVISMERFASELKAVNCSNNMMMAFKSNASYSSAINSWEWVNFNENRTFIIIANYP